MKLILQRIAAGEGAVLGNLYSIQDTSFCFPTLEPDPPIPAGTYSLKKYLSPRFKYKVWLFEHVPGHSFIEIHIGNTKVDTRLCILIGEEFGRIGGEVAVTSSKHAFSRFMEITSGERRLDLTIRDVIINPNGGKSDGNKEKAGSGS